jgi:hypothetical protein
MLDQTTSPLERALLREGRSYRAPSELRDHTLAALGIATSSGIASGLLAWLAAKSLAAKISLTLSMIALLTAVPLSYILLGHRADPANSASPVVPLAHATMAVPAAPSAPDPVPAPDPAPATAPSAAAKPAPAANAALRAELRALDAVRSALANGKPPLALSLVATYFRTFQRGRLYLEAEVLRIDTLAKAGQPDAAGRYARDFIKRHPNNILSARVRPYAEN